VKKNKKFQQKYSDEFSLISNQDTLDYIRLNIKRIRSHRRLFEIPVIAIAGAEGKSTTKRMLASILSTRMNILETPPNCSTAHGITTTLLELDSTYDAVVLELGIVDNQQFSLAIEAAEPNIAAVTNIGEAHLATLGDKFLIADAKTELIKSLPEDGIAILNMDDDLVSALSAFSPTRRIIKFGLNSNAHFSANDIEYLGPDGIRFCINGYYAVHMPIYSSTSIYNALTATAIARALDIDFEDIIDALSNRFKMLQHRGNLLRSHNCYVLDYSYDATVNSVTKELEAIIQFKNYAKKLVLVIGDIRYSGKKKELQHLKIGYIIAASQIDAVVTVGQNARKIAEGIEKMSQIHKKEVISIDHPEKLPEVLPQVLEDGCCVMITGSRDLNLSYYVEQHFATQQEGPESKKKTPSILKQFSG
jgi:UDP-N-acetylmuramoyl-tripeptide--D-alanyl-D-alanine ligase